MSSRPPAFFGIIHVGSEQVSLQIVEYTSLQEVRIVERACTTVSLGEETFKTGRISFAAVKELCELLKGYRRIMNEYGVKDYRLVATTAIREAANQQYIIDQIKVKTGFTVEVVDMMQEIFHKYIALYRTIEAEGLAGEEEAILFVDISSGGLAFILYQGGRIVYQQNIHIGALRIKESFEKYQRESVHFPQALTEYIDSTIELVGTKLSPYRIKYLVLSGAETSLLLKLLGRDEGARLSYLAVDQFHQLYERVKYLGLAQLMRDFNLNEHRAEMVLPTVTLYQQILNLSNAAQIIVSNAQFNDGLAIAHIGDKTGDKWLTTIDEQIVSFAWALGQKYMHDPLHAASVETTALMLFDRLARVHGLGKRERFQLKVAAILHDIGKYVNLRRHYFYSYRLIVSSDILGFSDEERALMANIAYYHSKGTPSPADGNFAALSPAQRLTLAKLAAIIRLADAIDRSHLRKAVVRDVALVGEDFVITLGAERDMSLEEWTFADKAEYFENVFGLKPVLKLQIG